MARRLRQVIDLYVTGRVLKLRDGSYLWVQVMNPFEQDTARNEAQIAKARLTLALKEYGSDETQKVRMYFLEDGREEAAKKLVDAKTALASVKVIEGIRNDPEWTERLAVLDRGESDTAKPLEEIEAELLIQLSSDFAQEVTERLRHERELLTMQFKDADEDTLWKGYLDWYCERRASELMMAEYRLHQVLFGARWCEDDGSGEHAKCDGHSQRLFDTKDDVRSAPEDLIADIMDVLDDIELSVRDAKNSDRQGSSSGSFPLPSEVEASTASTPTETPDEPRGHSSSPSVTPSPSSAMAS